MHKQKLLQPKIQQSLSKPKRLLGKKKYEHFATKWQVEYENQLQPNLSSILLVTSYFPALVTSSQISKCHQETLEWGTL